MATPEEILGQDIQTFIQDVATPVSSPTYGVDIWTAVAKAFYQDFDSGTGTNNHDELINLDHDDHLQYYHIDGRRNKTDLALVFNLSLDTLNQFKVIKVQAVNSELEIPNVVPISNFSDTVAGIVVSDILSNTSGVVLKRGIISSQLDTSTASIGDKIYSDSSGNLTLLKTPLAVGIVVEISPIPNIYIDISSNVIRSTDDLPEGIVNLYADSYKEIISGLNSSGSTLDPYRVVKPVGTDVNSLGEQVATIDYISSLDDRPVGLTQESIGDTLESKLITYGAIVTNLDTTAATIGDLVFSDASGNLQLSPTTKIRVGRVLSLGTSGVIFVDFTSSQNILTTDDLPEGSINLYYTTARFDTRFATKTTSDLTEGTNLYYTTARFDTRFASKTTDDLTQGSTNKYYSSTLFNADFATKTTDNLTEGSTNLYYTTARFDARFDIRLATKTTSDLAEGSNLYYTSARFNSAFAAKTTTDLTEGTNLYYTSARFDSAFATKTTTNLAEGTNLYYTTARFNTAFATKSTTDLAEGTNLYYTSARFNTAFAAKTTDDLTQGSTNKYYSSSLFNTDFATKTTDNLTEGSTNKYYSDAQVTTYIKTLVTGKGYLLSRDGSNNLTGFAPGSDGFLLTYDSSQTSGLLATDEQITLKTRKLNFKVKNTTGSSIAAFTGVKANGDDSTDDIPTVAAVSSSVDVPIGIVTATFSNNTTGYILKQGRLTVTGFDTTGSTAGSAVYMNTSGALTLTSSTFQVGVVLTLNANGVIYFNFGGGASGGITSTNTPGLIMGGLDFNTSSTPPTVLAGNYEVNGTMVTLTANTTTSVTGNAFLNSRQAFDAVSNYYLAMDNAGNIKFVLATGSVLRPTQAVTNLTGSTTKTVTVGTITSIVAGSIAVFTGAGNSILGIYVVSNIVGSTFQIVTTDTTNVFASLNVTVYNNVTSVATGNSTLAGAAANAQVTPNSSFNVAKNGYYLDATGVSTTSATTYRILGTFSTTNSNIGDIPGLGYRSGRNRNDNYWEYYTQAGRGSTATSSPYFTNIQRAYGNDYTITNDSTNGHKVTVNTSGKIELGFSNAATGGGVGPSLYIVLNDAGTGALGNVPAVPSLKAHAWGSVTGSGGGMNCYYKSYLQSTNYLRLLSTAVGVAAQATTWGSLEVV